ncbi:MAG: phosphoadenylyl-sulfate reductase [Steroidobacteraceae bacterium]|nr:phosphoadenylyl-sulfate reductase [Steroidobacteraceae bacterium]MDW8258821.1 phosphoadenylyl-sulfate reductase [Gammaproteobacteria bacterium]
MPTADRLVPLAASGDTKALAALDRELANRTASERVAWALQHLPAVHVLSSSFGAQAAVSLHLVTRHAPQIPIVVIDTGYLFPETYQFIDQLTERLQLRLHVVRPTLSPAWLEARYGRLWEQGVEGLRRYGELVKAEPMRRALQELGAGTWISGLRRVQSRSRAELPVLQFIDGRFKLHPIVDWTDRDVGRYLREHDLPYHPLWDKGYVSIGDWHTTRPLHEAGSVEATRFFGLQRECGLHGLSG